MGNYASFPYISKLIQILTIITSSLSSSYFWFPLILKKLGFVAVDIGTELKRYQPVLLITALLGVFVLITMIYFPQVFMLDNKKDIDDMQSIENGNLTFLTTKEKLLLWTTVIISLILAFLPELFQKGLRLSGK